MSLAYISLMIKVGNREIGDSVRSICSELRSKQAVEDYDSNDGFIYAEDSEAVSLAQPARSELANMLVALENEGFAYSLAYYPESPEECAYTQVWSPVLSQVFSYPLLSDGTPAVTELELAAELGKPVDQVGDADLGKALRSFWKKVDRGLN